MSNDCCNANKAPVLSDEVKKILIESPFVALATMSREGKPHLIVVGKVKEIKDDLLIFGVYKMNKTRQNIEETGAMQVAVAQGKAGYRLSGKACVKDGEVHFLAEQAESLL